MIVDYYRPQDVKEALRLLEIRDRKTVFMGGGTSIDRYASEPVAVVDLQDVGLGDIQQKGNLLEIGATVSLQEFHDSPLCSEVLKEVILREATHNLRQAATIAGTLIASNGQSPFATALLALDPNATIMPGNDSMSLSDLLHKREQELDSILITKITLPLNVKLAYEDVSRTPADFPIVSAAVAVWPGGRTRVTLGGFAAVPALASDGPEMGGEETAARDAFRHASDEWASAEYRMDIAPILVKRCLAKIESMSIDTDLEMN